MKWKEFVQFVKNDERYKNMVQPLQTGSLPSEIFGDFKEELEERYSRDKKKVKDMIKDNGFELSAKSTLLQLKSAISSQSKFDTISEKNIEIIFQELLEKSTKEEKKK